jgi:hypothetical protein
MKCFKRKNRAVDNVQKSQYFCLKYSSLELHRTIPTLSQPLGMGMLTGGILRTDCQSPRLQHNEQQSRL